MRRMLTPALMMAALTAANLAHGAGFGIYEWSPSHNATGGTGKPVDAAVAVINPSAMTELSGTRLLVGASYIRPGSTVSAMGRSWDMKSQSFLIPNLYATSQLNDQFWLGFSTTSEFGLGTRFEKGWFGNWSNIETTLETVTVSPTLAFAANDWLSLGAGPRIMYLDFYNKRNIGAPSPLILHGDSIGYGGIASALVKFGELLKIKEEINFSLVYRSEVKHSLSGKARSAGVLHGDAAGNVRLPAATTAGLNWQASEKLNLGVSATYTEWSSYENLGIKINRRGIPTQKRWQDVWRLGAGASYQLNDMFTLMAGYVYDEDPSNSNYADYMLPPGNRHLLNAGVGCALNPNIDLTFGYTFIYMQTEFAMVHAPTGAYVPSKFKDSNAHVISAALAYKF